MSIKLNLPSYGMEAAAHKGACGLRSESGVKGEIIVTTESGLKFNAELTLNFKFQA